MARRLMGFAARARGTYRRRRAAARSLTEIATTIDRPADKGKLDRLPAYDLALNHLRGRSVRVVLVGDGAEVDGALDLWTRYFPYASFVAVRLGAAESVSSAPERVKPTRSGLRRSDPQVSTLNASTTDAGFWIRLAKRKRPSVVIHLGGGATPPAFSALFPMLHACGVFLVENAPTGARSRLTPPGDVAVTLFAGSDADTPEAFAAYLRHTVDSVTLLKGAALVTKARFRQRAYPVTGIADECPMPWHTDVGPAYRRVPAEIINGSPHIDRQWARLMRSPSVQLPAAVSGEISDATVLGSGIVLTASGRVLDESLNNGPRILRRASGLYRPLDGSVWTNEVPIRPVRTIRSVPGRRHVLLKQFGDANYGHWLIDTLPKIRLADQMIKRSQCVFVINQQADDVMRRVVTDSLDLAGVDRAQTLLLSGDTYEFERITVLGDLTRHPIAKSALAMDYLNELAEQVAPAGPDRIYLSRNAFRRRRLANEDELLPVLTAHGYTVLHPEQLTLRDQIAHFRAASFVVGNMGAAMANLVFSPPGVSVLSLATERMAHDYFYDIVCHKSGRYRGIQGRAAEDPPTLAADFVVDAQQVEGGLSWLHG